MKRYVVIGDNSYALFAIEHYDGHINRVFYWEESSEPPTIIRIVINDYVVLRTEDIEIIKVMDSRC